MLETVLGFIACIISIRCQVEEMETKVVRGDEANITEYSYSACLVAEYCGGSTQRWICGASILNQMILLTAAHCVFECIAPASIVVRYGNSDRLNASFGYVKKHMTHPCYNDNKTQCDVALLKMEMPLELSLNVGRVALYPKKFIPYKEEGKVAGWGFIDEILSISTYKLRSVNQTIILLKECRKLLRFAQEKIPDGVICGGGLNKESYVSLGDSGSALVVRGYIQVGIVSYKDTSISRSLVVYSDVGYYFPWIVANSEKLYCNR